MSDQLVWQLVRGHNSFMRKGLNGLVLSAEPGNLYNKHSYKYSGLANSKTVDIVAAEGSDVQITVSRPKNANKPATSKNKSVSKKRLPRKSASVQKAVGQTRPDLKNAARARISAVAKSQRAASAAAGSS